MDLTERPRGADGGWVVTEGERAVARERMRETGKQVYKRHPVRPMTPEAAEQIEKLASELADGKRYPFISIPLVFFAATKTTTEAVLLGLVWGYTRQGWPMRLTGESMSRKLCISRRTVSCTLNNLAERGLLYKQENGYRDSPRYTLDLPAIIALAVENGYKLPQDGCVGK